MKSIFALFVIFQLTAPLVQASEAVEILINYDVSCKMDFAIRPDWNRTFSTRFCNHRGCFLAGELIEKNKLVYRFDLQTTNQKQTYGKYEVEVNFLDKKQDFFPTRRHVTLENLPQHKGQCKAYPIRVDGGLQANCRICAFQVEEIHPPCPEGEEQICGDGSCYCARPSDSNERLTN